MWPEEDSQDMNCLCLSSFISWFLTATHSVSIISALVPSFACKYYWWSSSCQGIYLQRASSLVDIIIIARCPKISSPSITAFIILPCPFPLLLTLEQRKEGEER